MLKIGTRTSPLALIQTQIVVDLLEKHHGRIGAVKIVPMETQGDKILNQALYEFGGKGLFTKELEESLLEGTIDCAVHCLKDIPVHVSDNFEISAILKREDPRDAFLSQNYQSLADLPAGALVGTSSLRRTAFVKKLYPHLEVKLLRGNVGTRINKMKEGNYQGIILALAGLKRLSITHEIKEILDIQDFIPAPAQGVLCIESRKNDQRIKDLVSPIHDDATFFAAQMERLFLSVLEGSCKTPLAAYLDPKENDSCDFWYMSVGKDDVLNSGCIKDVTSNQLPEAIKSIALKLKTLLD